jgi:glutathione peroxidase
VQRPAAGAVITYFQERTLMRFETFLAAVFVASLFGYSASAQEKGKPMATQSPLYRFTMESIDGSPVPLSNYRGDVLLIVNVASFCGYTPQYEDIESVYEQYKDKGLRVLAFPANNFGNQEPGSNEEIKEFCTSKYDVTFDLFSKISVKGEDQHPLYRYITTESSVPGEVKWNFQKYLVDRSGNIVAMFPSKVKPTDDDFIRALEGLLAKKS